MPATVLLIDRDADSVAIYSLLLRHHGYDVIHAHDGETGLRLAFEAGPDLVVSELFTPHGTRTDLVDRLRRDDRTAGTPLIVLDSIPAFTHDSPGAFGNLSRLTKPCEPSRLLHEVKRLLGGRQ
jgi:DNA-binding response OmpR family regulator